MSKKVPVMPAIMSTLAALAALAAPTSAAAAIGAPLVATGSAHEVSYGTAVLSGNVNPHGESTTYYFQYGTTRAYGLQSTPVAVGAGIATLHVSADVSGLQPASRYHYRLVALNGAGARTGTDHTFKTVAIPLSLQILGAPNPVQFGAPVVVEGTLSGTGNASRAVVLQQNPFPYTQGFVDLGEPHLTTAAGSFAFPVLGLSVATQFRVVTTGGAPVVSPIVIEQVAPIVTIHVRHTRRRHHARIYGTITPNEEGMTVEILRIGPRGTRLVGATFARRLSASVAHYDKVVRVHRGAIYEALVRVTNGAQTYAYSSPISVR